MNIRIDTALADKLKLKANKERASINALIYDILNKNVEDGKTINIPDQLMNELKIEAHKLNIDLNDYIILKLMK